MCIGSITLLTGVIISSQRENISNFLAIFAYAVVFPSLFKITNLLKEYLYLSPPLFLFPDKLHVAGENYLSQRNVGKTREETQKLYEKYCEFEKIARVCY